MLARSIILFSSKHKKGKTDRAQEQTTILGSYTHSQNMSLIEMSLMENTRTRLTTTPCGITALEPSPSSYMDIGLQLKGVRASTDGVNRRRWKSWFGVTPEIAAEVWCLLKVDWTNNLTSPNPEHLLWALSLLKTYKKEAEHASEFRVDEKTFRKWAFFYLEGIARLASKVVSALNSISFLTFDFILCML